MARHLLLGLLLLGTSAPPAAAQPRADALGDPLPKGAIARLGTARLLHDEHMLTAAFAPDGKTIAAAPDYYGGRLRLWETATGKPLPAPENSEAYGVHAVAYSPGGKLLAGACGRHVYLWK